MACEPRTHLLLKHDDAVPESELRAMADLFEARVESITPSQGETKLVFDRELSVESQARAKALLGQLASASPTAPPAKLSITVTEDDPEIIELLDLGNEKSMEIDLGLLVGQGEMALMERSFMGRRQTLCTWQIRTSKEHPSLTYTQKVEMKVAEGAPEGLGEVVEKANATFSQIVNTAEHELRTNHADYEVLLPKITLKPPREVVFVVQTQDALGPNPLPGMALAGEVSECADLICKGASGVFLTGMAFPKTSRALKSYELISSRF